MINRSTEEVFEDHLELAQKGDVETDIKRNFAPDCVLMTSYGVFHGHEGIRAAADLLQKQVGTTRYIYKNRLWHRELAFLEWTAVSDKASVNDGADSYWIRDGLILAMTAHYTVKLV